MFIDVHIKMPPKRQPKNMSIVCGLKIHFQTVSEGLPLFPPLNKDTTRRALVVYATPAILYYAYDIYIYILPMQSLNRFIAAEGPPSQTPGGILQSHVTFPEPPESIASHLPTGTVECSHSSRTSSCWASWLWISDFYWSDICTSYSPSSGMTTMFCFLMI